MARDRHLPVLIDSEGRVHVYGAGIANAELIEVQGTTAWVAFTGVTVQDDEPVPPVQEADDERDDDGEPGGGDDE